MRKAAAKFHISALEDGYAAVRFPVGIIGPVTLPRFWREEREDFVFQLDADGIAHLRATVGFGSLGPILRRERLDQTVFAQPVEVIADVFPVPGASVVVGYPMSLGRGLDVP